MENSKSTHPLVLVAAVCVILASLAAIAFFTGLIPAKKETQPAQIASAPTTIATATSTTSAPASPAVSPPIAAEASAAANQVKNEATTLTIPPGSKVTITPDDNKAAPAKPAAGSESIRRQSQSRSTQNRNLRQEEYPARQQAISAPPLCRECGTVDNIQEITVKGEPTGVGAVAGGVLGGVLGHQVGKGRGRDAATVVGAIGGAVGGHQIEKNVRSEKQYQVTVRFDDGSVRTFTQTNTTWRTGDRVRLVNGALGPL